MFSLASQTVKKIQKLYNSEIVTKINVIHNVIFHFHNTEGNFQYGRAICNMGIILHVCIIFSNFQ